MLIVKNPSTRPGLMTIEYVTMSRDSRSKMAAKISVRFSSGSAKNNGSVPVFGSVRFRFNTLPSRPSKEKTTEKGEFLCHGGPVVDEVKLSENISVQASGRLEGFVDLGQFSANETNTTPADHGMVVLFQPFAEKWILIVGNIQPNTCSALHPVDSQRRLYFVSDFPHLLKCLRNMFLKTGFNTPYGRVCKEPITAAYRVDSHVLPVRVMLRITHSTLYSNAFEKMRVNLTSRLFSDEVLRGLDLHHKTVEQNCGSYSATVKFVCLINKLIQVMTSRCPDDALRPQTSEATFIDDFLSFLTDWEEKAEDGGFVSKATAEGLRVTLESTKGILAYLGHLNYEFLMTARLSQDCIERLFGIIRQSNEANDYPTPTQFLLTVNCLSFYNLARSPPGGTVSEGVLNSLLGPPDNVRRFTCSMRDA
ncbi:hypothetical protein HPB47_002635 [Ixodes persulcatus]|uniref:Uncharacterized protein n=1 Tax=Ixodes persulcatus TaxID=34615 RepID=A0AC60PLT8_IXOPE|nr:hypothetical protein HPB47_002635 [Ixodes persulcatus]